MEWLDRLRREGLVEAYDELHLLYHPSIRPAVPPEYAIPDLVALTFRLRPRPLGGHVYVMAIDVAAAVRLGARMGLEEAASIAFVDSHERMHVVLQLEGVPEAVEEERARASWTRSGSRFITPRP